MGEEDSSNSAKGSVYVAPALTSRDPGRTPRGGGNDPQLPDRHVDTGGWTRGCLGLFRLPAAESLLGAQERFWWGS